MILNWVGILAGILSLALFFLCYRKGNDLSRRSLLSAASLLTILSLPGASFALYYTHLLPETAAYYEFRSWQGTELLVIPIGAAAGFWTCLLPSWTRIGTLLFAVLFSFAPFSKPILAPLPAAELRDLWKDNICLQSLPATCGAASLATVFRSLNLEATEEEIAEQAFTYGRGTEAWYLARIARKNGCEVQFNFADTLDENFTYPAIVGVNIGGIGHFIPVLGQENAKWITGDPLHGRRLFSETEFHRRYVFTGFHMRVARVKE